MRAATGACIRVTTRRVGLCWLLGVVIALGSPAVGHAGGLPTIDLSCDPWFVGWSELLPPAYMGVDTDSADLCVAGRIECVDRVADRLAAAGRRPGLRPQRGLLAGLRAHDQKVAAVERADPAFFADNPWLNHYDAVFADFYFSAWNSWRRTGSAPPAWAIAFDDRRSPGRIRGGQPAARHERPRQPRSAVRPVRDRPRRSRRIFAQGRPRSRQPDPEHGDLAPPGRDRGPLRPVRCAWFPGSGSLGDFLEFQALPDVA